MTASQTQGFVLQTEPYGESHRLVLLLTRDQGLLRVIANGAAKLHHPLFTATQQMTQGAFLVRLGAQGLGTLEQGETIRAFRRLHEDPVILAYALALGDVVIRAAGTDQAGPLGIRKLYDPLGVALERLAAGLAPGVVVVSLITRALVFMGLALLLACPDCGEPLSAGEHFSMQSSGFLCPSCAQMPAHERDWRLSKGASRVLFALAKTPLEKIGQVSIRPETEREMMEGMRGWLAECAGVHLRALTVAIAMDPRFIPQM